jgi:2,3-bisphosphoglycerate-independent phosphoglycerate mutase
VTFFWNGNRSGYFDASKEEYVEIPSDFGITFNVQPKMKAVQIAEKARDAILSGKFDQVEELHHSQSIHVMFCSL